MQVSKTPHLIYQLINQIKSNQIKKKKSEEFNLPLKTSTMIE